MPRILAFLAFLILAPVALWAQGGAQSICVANNPQYPAACPCVIDTARAQGIDGPVLDQLLANNTNNVPIQTFQAYGLIYVQCIQAAVLGQVPAPPVAIPAPQPPIAEEAAPQPQPIPDTPQTAGVTPDAAQNAGTGSSPLRLVDPIAPGEWGAIALDFEGGGRLVYGTIDGAGGIAALSCAYTTGIGNLIVAGLDAPAATMVDVEVRDGRGNQLISLLLQAQRYDGALWYLGAYPPLEDAIRRGSTLTVTPAEGTARSFGLSGSNRALGPGVCMQVYRAGLYADTYGLVADGVWDLSTEMFDAGQEPVLRYSVGPPFGPSVAIGCDRSLVLQSDVGPYGPRPIRAAIDAIPARDIGLEVAMDFDGRGLRSAPLPDGYWEGVAGDGLVALTFDLDGEPGEIAQHAYRTTGMAEGLAALECPAPFDPGPAPAPLAGAWASGEIADLPRPDLFASAWFRPEAEGIPWLYVDCYGMPFFDQSELGAVLPRGIGGYRLRLDFGDLVYEETFGGMRLWGRPPGVPGDVAAAMSRADSLRVTGMDVPGYDAVYPLAGLRDFLSGPLCRG